QFQSLRIGKAVRVAEYNSLPQVLRRPSVVGKFKAIRFRQIRPLMNQHPIREPNEDISGVLELQVELSELLLNAQVLCDGSQKDRIRPRLFDVAECALADVL